MPSPAATQIHSTTQQFLEIYDITNDVVIMKNGSTSMIITVDAMNFGLLAEEEQDAVMYAYAGLLNSLTYPVQIVIHSQTKDVTNYLNLLKEQETKASSTVKQAFIRQYREFVSELIKERNVLDKKFYIVVTATALEMGLLPPQTVVPGVKQIDISSIERSTIVEKARTILEPRRDHLIGQFGRIGLYARQFQTQEIIQLFYTSYNPEAAEGQQITDTSAYVTSVVEAQTPFDASKFSAQQMSPIPIANPPTPTPIPQAPVIQEAQPAVQAQLQVQPDSAPQPVLAAESTTLYQVPVNTALPPATELAPQPIAQTPQPVATATTTNPGEIVPIYPPPTAAS